jgi:hypothetical protein
MKKIIYKNSVDEIPAELNENEKNRASIKPRNKYNPKPKGTVLYTVVTVMMILLIFVLVTLGISSTANKRAYNTYYKNQTYYSAKSLVESVTDGLTDTAVDAAGTANGNLKGVIGTLGDATQVLAVGTPTEPGSDNYRLPNGMGTLVGGVKIIPSGTDTTGTENFIEGAGKPIIKVEATVELRGQESTYSRYVYIGVTPSDDPQYTDPGFVSLGGMSNTAVGHSSIGGTSSMVYGHQVGVPTGTYIKPRESLLEIEDKPIDELDSIALENKKANAASLNRYLIYNSNVGISDDSTYRISPKGGFVFNGHLTTNNNFTIQGIYNDVEDKLEYRDMPWMYIRGSFFNRAGNDIGFVSLANNGGASLGPVNIVAGQVVGNHQNDGVATPYTGLEGVLPSDIYGDVYMMNTPAADYLLDGPKLNFTAENNTWVGKGAGTNGATVSETYIEGVSVIGTDNATSPILDWTSNLVNRSGAAPAKFGNWYSEGSILYYMDNNSPVVQGDTIIGKHMLTWGNTGQNSTMTFRGEVIAKGGLVMLDSSRANIVAEKGIYVNIENSLFKGGAIAGDKAYLTINGEGYDNFVYGGIEYSTCPNPNQVGEGDYETAWSRTAAITSGGNAAAGLWSPVDINDVKAAFINLVNMRVDPTAPLVPSDGYSAKLGQSSPLVSEGTSETSLKYDYIDYVEKKINGIKNDVEDKYFSANGMKIKAVVDAGGTPSTENIYYESVFEYKSEQVNYTAPVLWMNGGGGDQNLKASSRLSAAQAETNQTNISKVAVIDDPNAENAEDRTKATDIINSRFGGGADKSVLYDKGAVVITGDVTLTSSETDSVALDSKTLFIDPTEKGYDIKINLVNWQTKNGTKIVVCNSRDGENVYVSNKYSPPRTPQVTFYVPAMPDELRTEKKITYGGFGNEYFGPGGGNGADKDTIIYEKDGNFDQEAQGLYIVTTYYDKLSTGGTVKLAEMPDDPIKIPNIKFNMNGDGDCRLQNFFGTGYFRLPYAYFGFRDGVADINVDYYLNTKDETDGAKYEKAPAVSFSKPHIIGSMVVGSFDLGNTSGNTGGSTGNMFMVVYVGTNAMDSDKEYDPEKGNDVDLILRVMD